MLLPSALTCDIRPLRRSQEYTKSTTLSTPPISPTTSSLSGILTSCRALHSLLNIQPPLITTYSNPPRPIVRSLASAPQTPSSHHSHTYPMSMRRQLHTPTAQPPAVNMKRSRELFEYDPPTSTPDKENLYHTPKRQRRAPPSLPLGLSRSDFQTLPPSLDHTQADPVLETGNTTDAGSDDDQRLEDNDHALVELVLAKLHLSRRDWDECAAELGTDARSLGRRWRYLVGEGEVGLRFRRGKGRRSRAAMEGMWD